MEILSFPVWKLDNIHWLNKRDRGPQERSSGFCQYFGKNLRQDTENYDSILELWFRQKYFKF